MDLQKSLTFMGKSVVLLANTDTTGIFLTNDGLSLSPPSHCGDD